MPEWILSLCVVNAHSLVGGAPVEFYVCAYTLRWGLDKLRIVSHVDIDRWEAFLSTVSSTVYHTPQWKQLLEKALGYTPFYLFALNDSDEIVGFLPLFKVKSLTPGSRMCSVPMSHLCGPLGTAETKNLLLSHAIELNNRGKSKYLEIRESAESSLFRDINNFSTYILNLDPEPQNVWKKLDKGSVRWAIKKAEKIGVTVEASSKVESLKIFYELNCLTKRKIGVPCHPWSFFKILFEVFGENVKLFLAKKGEQVIGGGVFLYYGEYVLYAYGAADPKELKNYPYNAFIWQCIKNACIMNYKYFDFGRTSYSDKGLENFKKNWGTTEKKLFYSFYPNDADEKGVDRDNVYFDIAKQIIKKTPLPLYKKISQNVFPFYG